MTDDKQNNQKLLRVIGFSPRNENLCHGGSSFSAGIS